MATKISSETIARNRTIQQFSVACENVHDMYRSFVRPTANKLKTSARA